MNRRSFLAFVVVALVPSTARAADAGAITVLAASSLTESLEAAGAAWTAKGHPAVEFSFDASSRLAKQVEAGAPADLFFSADSDWMTYVADRGLIDPATRVDLLGNHLVVVVPATGNLPIATAADLAKPEVLHLALAGESVPAGKYARAALANLGVWDQVSARVVSGDSVRSALSWVAGNEADAGVVYATDARVEPRVKVAFTLPDGSHPPIVYPAAVVKASTHAADAAAFLAWCRSDDGMAVFTAAGFSPAPGRR